METAAPLARGEGRSRWRMARRERVTVGGYRQRWTTTLLALLAVVAVLAAVIAYAVHVRANGAGDPFGSDPMVRFVQPEEQTGAPSAEPVTEPGVQTREQPTTSQGEVVEVPEVGLG